MIPGATSRLVVSCLAAATFAVAAVVAVLGLDGKRGGGSPLVWLAAGDRKSVV